MALKVRKARLFSSVLDDGNVFSTGLDADDIRALLVDNTPDGWLATLEATHAYGLSRQTLLQRVKRGEIRAVYLRTGRKKGLRIAPPAQQAGLF